ncbi:MAG: sortase [Candidatus Levybacteria bacterium]|nr:sortase [Candidatus Levybacteria bacterium]
MKRNDAIQFVVLRSLGNFLVLFSLYGVGATFGPAATEQVKYAIIQIRGVEFAVADTTSVIAIDSSAIPSTSETEPGIASSRSVGMNVASPQAPRNDASKSLSFAEILAGEKEQILIPKDSLFSILIPKIGASSQVFANVDAENREEFIPVLQKGVAHAKGSVFPGHPGNTYLFAHSADNFWDVGNYNAVFYTLGNLSENDEIIIFFESRRYTYRVTKTLVSDPNDVTYLTAPQTGPNRLILQTCWPPGTTWKRLYIVAEPKEIKD